MRAAHWHRFLVLTKRSERMRAFTTIRRHLAASPMSLIFCHRGFYRSPAAGDAHPAGLTRQCARPVRSPGRCPTSGSASRSRIKTG
jgi:hypothetical protein